jgi:hypothetical protein
MRMPVIGAPSLATVGGQTSGCPTTLATKAKQADSDRVVDLSIVLQAQLQTFYDTFGRLSA